MQSLLQGQGNAALHHVILSPTPQAGQGRWYLPHFTDEVKGLPQGDTSNAWQCNNGKIKQISYWVGTVLEPPSTGKFTSTSSRVACQSNYFCLFNHRSLWLNSTSNLVAKSIGSGAKLLGFKSRLYHLTAVWTWANYLLCLCLNFLIWGLQWRLNESI